MTDIFLGFVHASCGNCFACTLFFFSGNLVPIGTTTTKNNNEERDAALWSLSGSCEACWTLGFDQLVAQKLRWSDVRLCFISCFVLLFCGVRIDATGRT